MAGVTTQLAPPINRGLKPVGQNTATLCRSHESISIYEKKVFASRPLGGPLQKVDATGKAYIRMQIDHLIKMFGNTREFMASRMLRGGYSMVAEPDGSYRLAERSDPNATHVVNFNIPGENYADGDGLIPSGEGWNQASAPVHEHFLALDKKLARTAGFKAKHCILNSSTIAPLFNNTVLRNIKGDAMTIFNTFTRQPMKPEDAQTSAVYTVVFGAIPHIMFHVLNEGLVLDEVIPNEAQQSSEANFSLFVPDGKAIIIPDNPRAWCGHAVGREPVREETHKESVVKTGFAVWRTKEIDPARYDVKVLDNFCPILTHPKAVHFLDVWEAFTSSET